MSIDDTRYKDMSVENIQNAFELAKLVFGEQDNLAITVRGIVYEVNQGQPISEVTLLPVGSYVINMQNGGLPTFVKPVSITFSDPA